MKYLRPLLVVLTALFYVVSASATVIVSDTWSDGTRSDPTAANGYSENGTDSDSDGSIESAWYSSGASALTVPATGDLRAVQPTTSLSLTTYFTPEGSEVNLANTGDAIKVTWVFTPTTVNANNTGQAFPIALVNSPSGSRISSDTSPGPAAYTGYAVFMNVGQTLGNASPFALREFVVSSGNLLSTAGNWGANGTANATLANGATSGNHGFDSLTQYTFIMTLTRNASSGLDIVVTMSGGTYNGSGTGTITYTDTTPNSFLFDTLAMRPTGSANTFGQFDTSLFKVELISAATPPSIASDPVDQNILVGQDATFNVIASGSTPLSYQWYYNTNTLVTSGVVSSGTFSSLAVTNAQFADAGAYFVVVTNSYGSATSQVAQLLVNSPIAPSIGTQPQDQTNILPGATVNFSVVAFGSDPISYQWFYNTNTPVAGGTDSILTITNVQASDAGSYSVVINNAGGTTNSAFAFLTVNTNPVAPVFTAQPVSLIVLAGSPVSFTAVVAGTAPIGYQWSKNGTPIPGATSTTLNLANVQTNDNGSYTLTATNSVGSATSNPAQLTVTTVTPVVNSAYNLVGFAQTTTGGGFLLDTDPAYAKVTTPLELANAVLGFNKTGSPRVIEIMNDLDLGWNEVGTSVQTLGSSPFSSHSTPLLHPVLLRTGVSKMDIKYKNGGLTIFSANGATIRHCTFNIKSTHNIIVRNLKFDQMWEWDESSKGNYDKNDWDFIDLANGGAVSNVWIDHCTFTKAYDGIVDMKAGSTYVTLSWCKYVGDDSATNANSWVWQQITSLESNKTSYAFYNFLRNNGFSTTNIVQIIQGHDKTHLLGSNDKDSNNVNLSATFHHLWMHNVWDRAVPRLRAGNVHDFNNYIDDTDALAAQRLRTAIQHTMSKASSNTLQNTYSFNPPLNGSISTEGGAILVEKCVYINCKTPLRNNQTDPSDPTYTGKILGLDTIYQFDSTIVRGNSTDSGNPLGPFQAPIIAFSWNPASGAPGGVLPYAYTPDDPSQLQNIVTSPTTGAGSGVLQWNKTNWLLTAYAPTKPTITSDISSQSVQTNQPAVFVIVASGSNPLSYQWYFNTNTPLAGATNSTFTLLNSQTTNAGGYSVIVTNSAGSVTSQVATLTVNLATVTGFTAWQQTNFTSGQLADQNISGPDATPAGDGVPNFVKYALGIPPFTSQALFNFYVQGGEGILSYDRPASVMDVLYRLEVSTDLTTWTTNGVVQTVVGTTNGLQEWQGTFSGPASNDRYFRLKFIR